VTATPGTVKLEVDTNNTNLDLPNVTGPDGKLYLLLDATATGNGFADETPVQMYDDGTNGDSVASDSIWTRQTVSLVNNQTFTFAQQTPAGPGAVSANLKLWLKADSGLYTNAGTTLASISGTDTIQQWNDASGNSYNATQVATPTKRPLYIAGTNNLVMNYQPALDFDTTDGMDINTALSLVAPNDYSVIAVYNYEGATLAARRAVDGVASNWFVGPRSENDGQNSYYTGTFVSTIQNLSAGDNKVVMNHAERTSGNTVNIHRVNGRDITTSPNANLNQPGNLSLGNDGFASEPLDGKLSEVIVYGDDLAGTARTKVESYLALKYGITMVRAGDTQGTNNTNVTISADVGQTFSAAATGYINQFNLLTGATTANGSTGILYICNG
jgi:hypothetical protein